MTHPRKELIARTALGAGDFFSLASQKKSPQPVTLSTHVRLEGQRQSALQLSHFLLKGKTNEDAEETCCIVGRRLCCSVGVVDECR